MIVRLILPLGLSVALAGCSVASGPLSAPPVPANPGSAADVSVYRATAVDDDEERMVVTVNGEGVYQLRPGERYDFVLDPGDYTLGYRMATDDCSVPIRIAAEANYVFKLGSECAIVLESE
ncbi:MAG: hypothetical protein LJE69_09615 [Thiohalocapsa sp.]|jgi:hypothetical protein|uniref:hypothetical protein n=1 Tax=Thiohalocapsa sp. TaxID=2497641 RepID=UPI0025EF526B|nr:hypothetical protein [Thiohalocapsa sp.]MCG6941494.1 hypothetical protein [Thiohalocapsa sp.]